MTEKKNLDDGIENIYLILDEIDSDLADIGVPTHDRPFRSVLLLIHDYVLEVRSGDESISSFAKPSEHVSSDWFKDLFAIVNEWFERRYGNKLIAPPKGEFIGCVLIYKTPFLLHVPVTYSKKAEEEYCVWLQFPDEIKDSEDPIDWIVNRPDIDINSHEVFDTVKNSVKSISVYLRRINVALTGVSVSSEEAPFQDGFKFYLEGAAFHIAKSDKGNIQRAYWDLQMACESFLKLLCLQNTNNYPKIHNLNNLCDRVGTFFPDFDSTMVKDFPNEQDILEYRYGQKATVSVSSLFYDYLSVLRFISSNAFLVKGMDLRNARFKVALAPWKRP